MPVTVTASVKVTVTLIASPTVYEPFVLAEVMFVTVGVEVEITMFLLAANEPAALGVASVNVALLPTASLIVPLFNAKDVVAT